MTELSPLLARLAMASLVLQLGCGRTQPYRDRTGGDPSVGPIPDTRQKEIDAGTPDRCVAGVLNPKRAVPKVFFVVDRSGSMQFDLAGNSGDPFTSPLVGPRRWDVLFSSLGKTLPANDFKVAMGAIVFPGGDGCGVDPSTSLQPDVGNATSLLALYSIEPGGGTPTFDALAFASVQARAAGVHALVLITDGEPNCNLELDPATCVCSLPLAGFPPTCPDASDCLDDVRSIELIHQLRAHDGIVTYVVGLGAASSTSTLGTLDKMALAGGAARESAPHFYSALSEVQVAEALEAINTHLTDCSWTAHTRIGEGDSIEVRVGEQVVPVNEGWTLTDPTQGSFALVGDWCNRATLGAPVTIRLTCR